MRAFLWNDGDVGRYLSLLQWEKLCHKVKLGGLGFRKMDLLHRAFMAKQIVRASHSVSSIWARVVCTKYHVQKDVPFAKSPKGCSWAWRAVAKGSQIVQDGVHWAIGDSSSIPIGDKWSSVSLILREPTLSLRPVGDLVVSDLINARKE